MRLYIFNRTDGKLYTIFESEGLLRKDGQLFAFFRRQVREALENNRIALMVPDNEPPPTLFGKDKLSG